jgi:hypothetical protein
LDPDTDVANRAAYDGTVSFREDSEALLARADALQVDLEAAETKLADATEDNAALEAEAKRLRDEVAALRARLPEPEIKPPAPLPMGSALKPPEEDPLILVGETPPAPGLGWGHLIALIIVVTLVVAILGANQG